MRVGDIITAIHQDTTTVRYVVVQPIGKPGLFGQAFLCRRVGHDDEAVVKTLRTRQTRDGRERLAQEARTLEQVAAAEDGAGVQYAVRLLGRSAPDDAEPFIVLERATGQNVLADLVEPVADWQHAPLDEQLVLDIAGHLARALHTVHQAGLCYHDLKLDNLFWDASRPASPLRIIDWNVTSPVAERGVAGDWARFGARLYELCTGEALGVSRDGTLLGSAPAGPRWQEMPEGIRDLITQALYGRYVDDETLLRDMQRESAQARMDWPQLLEQATIADGADQTIEVLAPLWRAERQLQALPPDTPDRAANLARCAELRQRATARRGIASQRAVEQAAQSLARGEARLAAERLQRVYADAGARDPRPRRWLWLAQLAAEQPGRYRLARMNLEAGVEALNRDDAATASNHLKLAHENLSDVPAIGWLLAEADAISAAADGKPANGVHALQPLADLFDRHPDLRAMYANLQELSALQRRRLAAHMHEQALWDYAAKSVGQAQRAASQAMNDRAVQQYERALVALEQLLADGCSPERAREVYIRQQAIQTRLDELQTQLQTQRIPDMARSAEARQRREALQLAEQLLPDWADLPHLRAQVQQIDACFALLERHRDATQLELLDQAVAAIDTLLQLGIAVDLTGADLREIRRDVFRRRADNHRLQAQEAIADANRMLEQASRQLDLAVCHEARLRLQHVTPHDVAGETRNNLQQALSRAVELERLLDRAADAWAAIEAARAADDLAGACRLVQQAATALPQFPRFAENVSMLFQELWRRLAVVARQSADVYAQLSLRQSSAADLHAVERQRTWLLAQRRQADALAPPAVDDLLLALLRQEADTAIAAMEQACLLWERRRDDSIGELRNDLDRIERELEHGNIEMAYQSLARTSADYLAADAHDKGLEALVIRATRLNDDVNRRRQAFRKQMEEWAACLDDPTASIRYNDLVALVEAKLPADTPEEQQRWAELQQRAIALRQAADRVIRPGTAGDGAWPEEVTTALDALRQEMTRLREQFTVQQEESGARGQSSQPAAELGSASVYDELFNRQGEALTRLNQQFDQLSAQLARQHNEFFAGLPPADPAAVRIAAWVQYLSKPFGSYKTMAIAALALLVFIILACVLLTMIPELWRLQA